ncbi:hypothetical protein [Halobacterium hubeiense]|uniref:hypothetical protein n=1 Tax=Halobacterium hubeiense TaxID=1407499 RepID=UPI00117A9699|nr:hypothetical protein [Halobacterium hubeiense]
MVDYSIGGIILVIVGVLLIVFGAGTAFAGFNKMDAADDWSPPTTDDSVCTVNIEGDINKENMQKAEQKCSQNGTPENPYTGGETDVLFGSLLVVIGGSTTYFGSRR